MKLTGKTKEAFLKFTIKNYGFDEYAISYLKETLQNALIIEFFDSVGITVDVIPRISNENKIVFEPNTLCLKYEIVTENFINFKLRPEATDKAIEKANEIYNEMLNK